MQTTAKVIPEAEPPFIRQKDITGRFGTSRATQHRLRRLGLLPEGIRIGPRTVIYSEARVLEAISKLAVEQNSEIGSPTLQMDAQSDRVCIRSSDHRY